MKVNLEKLTNLERKLNIEVPVEKVAQAFDRVYKSIQENVSIKGFRKGKTPLDMIKKMYKDKVSQDVIETLVREFYPKALDEHTLNPISYPNIEFDQLKEGHPFSFTAQFEIRPDVKLGDYKGLAVQKEQLIVDDKKVEDLVTSMLQHNMKHEEVTENRPAQMGDVTMIDFEGTLEGKPLENATGHSHMLKLGSNQFIPGFEEGIVGMKVGDSKELHLAFPTEYHATQLAGKSVTFKVKLNSLKKEVLPELNDEFAKTYGYDGVAGMRDAGRKSITLQEERRIQDELKNRVMKALVAANPVDVPQSLLKEQKKILIDDVIGRMKMQGLPESDTNEYVQKWDEDFAKSATFIIQSSFLINAIAAKENIEVTEQDIDDKITDLANDNGMEIKAVKQFYSSKPEHKARLEFQVLEEKVVNFVLSEAKVTEVAKEKLADLN